MQITSHEKVKQHQYTIREMAELEIFDILTELLSISFEKYDVEVILESDSYLNNHDSALRIPGLMQTEIDFEDIVETQNTLEFTLSGNIKGLLNFEETFMLFFSLQRDHEVNPPWQWKPDHDTSSGVNSLYLHYGRKAEQLFDPIFSVSWVNDDSNGNRQTLGQGKGILTFSGNQRTKAN